MIVRFFSARRMSRLAILALAGLTLAAPEALAKSGSAGVARHPTATRDHREKPVLVDHRVGGAGVVRDQRGGTRPVTVTTTRGHTRKVPCLGNLC